MITVAWRRLCSTRVRSCAEQPLIISPLARSITADTTEVQRWATGLNDYWPTIQNGLGELPVEINAVSERIYEECKREDDMINDHLDMLIELLQGYKVSGKSRLLERASARRHRICASASRKLCKPSSVPSRRPPIKVDAR